MGNFGLLDRGMNFGILADMEGIIPPKSTKPIVRNTYLDAETNSIMETLGDGNVSLGIRRAGELVKWLQLKHPLTCGLK